MSRPGVADDVIVAAVAEAYHDEDVQCDALDGGVRPSQVHDALPVELSMVRLQYRLAELVDDDKLRQVEGADPETYRPRPSYKPADDLSESE